jgi:hypothetical protein
LTPVNSHWAIPLKLLFSVFSAANDTALLVSLTYNKQWSLHKKSDVFFLQIFSKSAIHVLTLDKALPTPHLSPVILVDLLNTHL